MSKGKGTSQVAFWLLKKACKAYMRVRTSMDRRFLDRGLIRLFGGLHPKNVFNFRAEFFVDNVSPDDRVMDIGCGSGYILSRVASLVAGGVGIDYNPSLIPQWKALRLSNIEFVQKNFVDPDFFDFCRAFKCDTCILSHVLEHIEHPVDFLMKLNVTKLLICVPSQENWRAQLLIRWGMDHLSDPSHYREYTREMLKKELADAGFAVKNIGFNGEGEIVCRAGKAGV